MPTRATNTVDAGSLRHLLTIQQRTVSATGDRGQPVYTWTTLATPYGRIDVLPPYGKKAEVARQLVASATHTVVIRYLAGLTVGCRVQWNGRTFNIGYVADHDERQIYQTLLVTEQLTGVK